MFYNNFNSTSLQLCEFVYISILSDQIVVVVVGLSPIVQFWDLRILVEYGEGLSKGF